MQDFDVIVDPATLSKGKPDPEIFIQAAKGLNIKPSDAVGFEDAQAGIDGIKAAGMYAVGVYSGEELHGADTIVEKLTDLSIDELLAK
ncbi:Beta-phosphoglucomutase [Enterococcus sp. HSIEG1]|nr:Beta-phosphoglucomutase [Enterococcus sp. HSIEG1]